MTAGSNKVQMRPDPTTMGWLTDRAARMSETTGMQAKAELGLWRAVLHAELGRIQLTVAEAYCAASAVGTAKLEPAIALTVGHVYGAVHEECRLAREGRLPQDWCAHFGADEHRLLSYLGLLGPAADHALADAISRWWDQDLEPTAEGFAAVGLRVTEP